MSVNFTTEIKINYFKCLQTTQHLTLSVAFVNLQSIFLKKYFVFKINFKRTVLKLTSKNIFIGMEGINF